MKRRTVLAAAAALTAGASRSAFAQGFPQKPLRLIVPYAPGGQTDVLARAFAQLLGESLKQVVVVENKTGAGGNLGIQAVAQAAADGYTIGLGTNGPLAANVTLFKPLPYDPAKDLAAITRVALVPNVLVVHPSLPATNVRELIELLKANPSRYSYASGGNGTTQHLGGELFKLLTGTGMTHVPYRGENPAITDTLSGLVPIIFSGLAVGVPHVKAGKLRALAVTSATRSPSLPDVPTMAEAGVPNYEITAWYGLVAPAGVSTDIVRMLSAASVKVLNSPAMIERIVSIGGTPASSTSEEFQAFIQAEIRRWADLIQRTGAKAE